MTAVVALSVAGRVRRHLVLMLVLSLLFLGPPVILVMDPT